LKGIERKEKEREKKEEEERRGNEVETPLNHDRDQSIRHFLFCVLRVVVS